MANQVYNCIVSWYHLIQKYLFEWFFLIGTQNFGSPAISFEDRVCRISVCLSSQIFGNPPLMIGPLVILLPFFVDQKVRVSCSLLSAHQVDTDLRSPNCQTKIFLLMVPWTLVLVKLFPVLASKYNLHAPSFSESLDFWESIDTNQSWVVKFALIFVTDIVRLLWFALGFWFTRGWWQDWILNRLVWFRSSKKMFRFFHGI